jgi:hypothetical protein
METGTLADLIQKSDATDIQALLTAKESAKRNMLDDPSSNNVAAFERAKKALESFIHPEESDERVFAHRIEALGHLQAQGYKIKKSKLYDDAKKGFLRLQPDGSIAEKDLERYVKRIGLTKPAEISDTQGSAQHSKKLEVEIAKLEEEYREKRHRNDVRDGLFMPRDRVYMEIAGRTVVFEAGLKHAIDTRAADLEESLQAVADKHQRLASIRRWFREVLDEQLNEFADIKTFQAVILESEEEANETFSN